MKLNLVEQIVCPECHTNFSLKTKKKQKEEIIQGTLTCTKKHNFLSWYVLLKCLHFDENASSVSTKSFWLSDTNRGIPLMIGKLCFLIHVKVPWIIKNGLKVKKNGF